MRTPKATRMHPIFDKLSIPSSTTSKECKILTIDLFLDQFTNKSEMRNKSFSSKLPLSGAETVNTKFQAESSNHLIYTLMSPLNSHKKSIMDASNQIKSPVQFKIEQLKKSFGIIDLDYELSSLNHKKDNKKKENETNLIVRTSFNKETKGVNKLEAFNHTDNSIINKINTLKKESFFQDNKKDTAKSKIDTKPVKIFDWLILGGKKHSLDLDYLKSNQIDCILNAAIECQNFFPNQFHYKKIPICDTPNTNLKMYLKDVCDFLEECRSKGKRVYVHCYMGRSRSTSCIISYMIKYKGYSYESAYLFIRNLKPDVNPNQGFIKQLKAFEDDCKKLKYSK